MFENPRKGRQARNLITNVPKILGLKSSSEQKIRKLTWGAPDVLYTILCRRDEAEHFSRNSNQTVKNHFLTDIDECDDGVHDCLPSLASCVNTLGSFNCSCNHGYIGDGKTTCADAAGKISFKRFFSTYH